MRHVAWNTPLIAALALAGAIPMACGKSGGTGSSQSTGTGSGGSGGSGGNSSGTQSTSSGDGGNCFPNCSGTGSGNGMLGVMCDASMITVLNGSSMPVHCDAIVDGNKVSASWIVDVSSVANVDASGTVTATGAQGGNVNVKATFEGQTATATVLVMLKKQLNAAGTTPGDQTLLQGASAADTTVWAYPYNGTVFPKGLLAPEMMWNGGGAGDQYYVHLKSKFVDFEFFSSADPPSKFVIDDTSWKQLTESGPGGAVAVHVSRLPKGTQTPAVVIDHGWTIANGSLRGTVYYWSNNLGRVIRIKPGAAAPDDFLPAAAHDACSTCHAVSANGSTLVIGGDTSVSVLDLLTNTPVLGLGTVGKPVRNWAMPAISPNGKVLIENSAPLPGPPGGSDGMWDVATGTKILGTGLDGAHLDMPAFGPSGTKIAYVDHNSHGLNVYDYDANTNMAQNAIGLVPAGADPSISTIAFPSVSPDAKWIVYHRGSDAPAADSPNGACAGSRATLDTRCGPADLYMASVDQPGVEVRLDNANGDNYPFAAGARDLKLNYEPTFAPLNAGGYMWVVFTGRRTYGNQLTSPYPVTSPKSNPNGVGVKQLWVMAIDENPQAGVDPSHPAFWVPGQDPNTLNMRGFWALDPCKQVGQGCGTGSECCNQNCDTGICKDPDPNTCSMDGNLCTKDGDCCNAKSKCINGFCSEPPPM